MRNLKYLVLIGGMGLALTLSGCHTWNSQGRSEGQVIHDQRITSSVKDKLSSDPVYKYDNVDVKVFGGVVQLSGFVDTDAQKSRATELAQSVPGVARVDNAITLKPQVPSPTGRTNAPIEYNTPNPSTPSQPANQNNSGSTANPPQK